MKGNTDHSEVQKELRDLSPLLANLREQGAGFTAPENYFEDLTGDIMQKTIGSNTKVKEKKNGGLRTFLFSLQVALQPRYALAMTALALLIVAGLFWLRPTAKNRAGEIAWSDISVEEMTSYVQAHIQEFDLETFAEVAPNLETQSILKGTEIEPGILDEYLEEIMDDVDIEELEYLF